ALTLGGADGRRGNARPGEEGGIRRHSGGGLVVLGEAGRVPDEVLAPGRPLVAVADGRLVALATPAGRRGWFWQAWEGGEAWVRVRVRAAECPRISPEFLEQERQALGERAYRQEYETSFEDTEGAVFGPDDLRSAFEDGGSPLWRT